MAERYDPHSFEPKWQQRWQETRLYRTPETPNKPKFYCLDFFPYPSGNGLSVGHCRNYVPTDVVSRFKRMNGFNVLHPMGWDAFGLPAENEAILKGTHPRITVPRYVANYKRQLNLIGTSYDWEREVNSSSPDYYKWTQWFFLLLYKRGLAYRSGAPANWCPSCETVLANEEVEDGACWRCHTPVSKRDLPQWFFRITAYADQLLDDLDTIDWPEKIVLMQRNWIGRSEGVEFDLPVKGAADKISVFTTRVDTVFGMTFVVLAPEHPLVDKLTTPDKRAEMEAYVAQARRTSEIERLSTEREQNGVFIGAYAINPMNGREAPVFIGDYVLQSYGTGAIMAVPAHDTRDYDFAKRYGLDIPMVIAPPNWCGEPLDEAYVNEGTMVNSSQFNGMPSRQGMKAIARFMEEHGIGHTRVNYRMRDWLISRQRYWGAPIPIVHCERCGEVAVPDEQLPVMLPDIDRYQPSGTGQSPLANVPEFVNTVCPQCGGSAQRETDTMGGFACSSWYFLRFASPHYEAAPFDPEAMRYWLPVDLYVGGAEHAVMHLLYARFWTKVMHDAGLVPFREPFQKLMNQGIVHAADGLRMSKSRGNVITPDSVVEQFGADSLRCYELFVGPFEQDVIWSDRSVSGVYRWLSRVWDLVLDSAPYGEDRNQIRRLTHATIKTITQRIDTFRFNTAIAGLMEFVNALYAARDAGQGSRAEWQAAKEALVVLLAPVAPHIAEELWERTGHGYSVHEQAWPSYNEALAAMESVTLVLQVNGKLRDRVQVEPGLGEDEARLIAFANPRVTDYVNGRDIRRMIYVPDKLLNLVV